MKMTCLAPTVRSSFEVIDNDQYPILHRYISKQSFVRVFLFETTMIINPRNVLRLLEKQYETLKDETPINAWEIQLVSQLVSAIESFESANYIDMETTEDLEDSILKLQSLTHRQFSAPQFVPFIKFSWIKAGYFEESHERFVTPVQFCFKDLSIDICEMMKTKDESCNESVFIRCAWCEKYICFEHFFEDFHYCSV